MYKLVLFSSNLPSDIVIAPEMSCRWFCTSACFAIVVVTFGCAFCCLWTLLSTRNWLPDCDPNFAFRWKSWFGWYFARMKLAFGCGMTLRSDDIAVRFWRVLPAPSLVPLLLLRKRNDMAHIQITIANKLDCHSTKHFSLWRTGSKHDEENKDHQFKSRVVAALRGFTITLRSMFLPVVEDFTEISVQNTIGLGWTKPLLNISQYICVTRGTSRHSLFYCIEKQIKNCMTSWPFN